MPKPSALTLEHVSFGFNERKPHNLLFKDIMVWFEENKLHFIKGKNGAGKSTLFRLLRGNVFSDEVISGSIKLYDNTYNLANPTERAALSSAIRMVPQDFNTMLADQFSFIDNMRLSTIPTIPSITKGLSSEYSIPELIKGFDINFETPVQFLSGGQRQILAILMSLQKPISILLLDEPTAALDDKNASMVINFLQQLLLANQRLTVIVICHDKELVEAYAPKTYYQIHVQLDNTRNIEIISK